MHVVCVNQGVHVRRRFEEHSDVLVAFVKALAMVKVPCQTSCMSLQLCWGSCRYNLAAMWVTYSVDYAPSCIGKLGMLQIGVRTSCWPFRCMQTGRRCVPGPDSADCAQVGFEKGTKVSSGQLDAL